MVSVKVFFYTTLKSGSDAVGFQPYFCYIPQYALPIKEVYLLSQFLSETSAYLRLPVSFQASAYPEKGALCNTYSEKSKVFYL